ncbi:hypothetical protein MMC28_003375 [Mycoblastus sanguinarius]|nr:hypothetical protein [Mycoblastus sanguinarius]
MYSGRSDYGSGRNGHSSGRGSNGNGSSTNSSSQNRHLAVPPQLDTTSRRRSMTIQDMLNPSDEDARRSPPTPSSPSSSDEERGPPRPTRTDHSSQRSIGSPRSGPHSHRVDRSPRPGGRSRRPSATPSAQSSGSRLPRSPEVPARTRSFRPTYNPEEVAFIWYLRIDRGYLWPDIMDAFNARFARSEDEKRDVPGLQCRYYRLVTENDIPNVRNRRRDQNVVDNYGYEPRARAGRQIWYPWLNSRLYPSNAYGESLYH